MRVISSTILAAAFCSASLAAHADTFTYTYVGNHFLSLTSGTSDGLYTTSDFVTGYVTFANELGKSADTTETGNERDVIAFSFSDGVDTLNGGFDPTQHNPTCNTCATLATFEFGTDAEGAIVSYAVYLGTANLGSEMDLYKDVSGAGSDFVHSSLDDGHYPAGTDKPGTWTETRNVTAVSAAVIPEPSTFVLLTTGCIGMLGLARRRRSIWRRGSLGDRNRLLASVTSLAA